MSVKVYSEAEDQNLRSTWARLTKDELKTDGKRKWEKVTELVIRVEGQGGRVTKI
jgi:hypothetical protein